jgi:hypothetical protein
LEAAHHEAAMFSSRERGQTAACLTRLAGCGKTMLVCLVHLVYLVCFVYLVDLFHLVSFAQPKNQTN